MKTFYLNKKGIIIWRITLLQEKGNINENIKDNDNKFTTSGITIWWSWIWCLCIYENF